MSDVTPPVDWRERVYGGGNDGSTGRRRRPPKWLRELILAQQDGCCLYCGLELGSTVYYHGRPVVLRTHWDHFIPFAYSQRNPSDGFVAACHVCNHIKGCLMFETVASAREFIRTARYRKGYLP